MTKKQILILIFEARHPDDLNKCPICNMESEIRNISTKRNRIYYWCNHYVNPLKGTFLYRTRIPLNRWWNLLSYFLENRGGITSTFAGKILKISQQGAYLCLKKIRTHLPNVDFSDSKILYIDEKFFGSKAKTQHKQEINSKKYLELRKKSGITRQRRTNMQKRKKLTIGIASDNGMYHAEFSGVLTESKSSLIANKHSTRIYQWALLGLFLKHLKNGLIVVTDGDAHIDKMLKLACIMMNIKVKQLSVSHGKNEYVKVSDDPAMIVSTNRVEGFWGRFSRNFSGNYTWCSRKNFHTYTQEYSWKSSNRSANAEELLLALTTKT